MKVQSLYHPSHLRRSFLSLSPPTISFCKKAEVTSCCLVSKSGFRHWAQWLTTLLSSVLSGVKWTQALQCLLFFFQAKLTSPFLLYLEQTSVLLSTYADCWNVAGFGVSTGICSTLFHRETNATFSWHSRENLIYKSIVTVFLLTCVHFNHFLQCLILYYIGINLLN